MFLRVLLYFGVKILEYIPNYLKVLVEKGQRMIKEIKRYNDLKEVLSLSCSQICLQNNIKIEIFISDKTGFNASVKKLSDNKYSIEFWNGCFNLNYIIENITKRYTKDDLNFFED